MKWFRRDLGAAGEKAACRFLKRRGYLILRRNYVCPLGEIDIICDHQGCIVFVEVKTLRSDAATDPENKVTPAKQRQVERVARAWLAREGDPDRPYRFDAVSVVMPPREKPNIRHIVEAFSPSR